MKFKDIVYHACLQSPKLEVELSDEFEVSQSTVRRWGTGVAKPHPTTQKLVAASIRRRQIKAARLALLAFYKDEPRILGIKICEFEGVGALLLHVSSQDFAPKPSSVFEGFPVVVKVDSE
jgi:hypothetical protein